MGINIGASLDVRGRMPSTIPDTAFCQTDLPSSTFWAALSIDVRRLDAASLALVLVDRCCVVTSNSVFLLFINSSDDVRGSALVRARIVGQGGPYTAGQKLWVGNSWKTSDYLHSSGLRSPSFHQCSAIVAARKAPDEGAFFYAVRLIRR